MLAVRGNVVTSGITAPPAAHFFVAVSKWRRCQLSGGTGVA